MYLPISLSQRAMLRLHPTTHFCDVTNWNAYIIIPRIEDFFPIVIQSKKLVSGIVNFSFSVSGFILLPPKQLME